MRSKFLILLSLILLGAPVFAQEPSSAETKTVEEIIVVPKKIENEISSAIEQIYGPEKASQIYNQVMEIA